MPTWSFAPFASFAVSSALAGGDREGREGREGNHDATGLHRSYRPHLGVHEIAHVDLTGDGSGDEGGAAFLEEGNGALR